MISNGQNIIFPKGQKSEFRMIDVGKKRPTRRCAIAVGKITMGEDAFGHLQNGTLPKGNVLALAEVAGITGAKNTPQLIPLCHSLPLDQVTIHFELDSKNSSVLVYCQAVAIAKTGVEMEALAGVNAALLTIWDLTKGIDPNLEIGNVTLLVKTGGKSGVWKNPSGIPSWLESQLARPDIFLDKKAAVLVMSDRASSGQYQDESGTLLVSILKQAGAAVVDYTIIPDDVDTISQTLKSICIDSAPDILFTTGGTGPGPRDVTPEALARVSDRMLEGFGDYLRAESLYFTDTAWLSRMTAGMVGATLVIAFPGSPKAVQECWDIIQPFIGDALNKIAKQGFKGK